LYNEIRNKIYKRKDGFIMNKVEILGVVTACVFALLGFSESGFVAAAGTCLFAISAVCLCIAQEESKKQKFASCKKALIRKRAKA